MLSGFELYPRWVPLSLCIRFIQILIFRMLRNNADAHRYSYFELGLPVEQLSNILLTPIRYVTLHLRDRPGAALLCYRYRPENTVVCVNRGPIQYGFHARAKAIQNSVNIT